MPAIWSRTWSNSRFNTSTIVLQAWAESGPVAWLVGMGSSSSFAILGIYPHLVLAETLAELGVLGFALLWGLVIAAYMRYFRLHALTKADAEYRGVCAAAAALFMFEIIVSFKQGSLLGAPTAFGFAIILGRLNTWAKTPEAHAEIARRTGQFADTPASTAAVVNPGQQAFGPSLGSYNPPPTSGPRRRVTPVFGPEQRPSPAGF